MFALNVSIDHIDGPSPEPDLILYFVGLVFTDVPI